MLPSTSSGHVRQPAPTEPAVSGSLADRAEQIAQLCQEQDVREGLDLVQRAARSRLIKTTTRQLEELSQQQFGLIQKIVNTLHVDGDAIADTVLSFRYQNGNIVSFCTSDITAESESDVPQIFPVPRPLDRNLSVVECNAYAVIENFLMEHGFRYWLWKNKRSSGPPSDCIARKTNTRARCLLQIHPLDFQRMWCLVVGDSQLGATSCIKLVMVGVVALSLGGATTAVCVELASFFLQVAPRLKVIIVLSGANDLLNCRTTAVDAALTAQQAWRRMKIPRGRKVQLYWVLPYGFENAPSQYSQPHEPLFFQTFLNGLRSMNNPYISIVEVDTRDLVFRRDSSNIHIRVWETGYLLLLIQRALAAQRATLQLPPLRLLLDDNTAVHYHNVGITFDQTAQASNTNFSTTALQQAELERMESLPLIIADKRCVSTTDQLALAFNPSVYLQRDYDKITHLPPPANPCLSPTQFLPKFGKQPAEPDYSRYSVHKLCAVIEAIFIMQTRHEFHTFLFSSLSSCRDRYGPHLPGDSCDLWPDYNLATEHPTLYGLVFKLTTLELLAILIMGGSATFERGPAYWRTCGIPREKRFMLILLAGSRRIATLFKNKNEIMNTFNTTKDTILAWVQHERQTTGAFPDVAELAARMCVPVYLVARVFSNEEKTVTWGYFVGDGTEFPQEHYDADISTYHPENFVRNRGCSANLDLANYHPLRLTKPVIFHNGIEISLKLDEIREAAGPEPVPTPFEQFLNNYNQLRPRDCIDLQITTQQLSRSVHQAIPPLSAMIPHTPIAPRRTTASQQGYTPPDAQRLATTSAEAHPPGAIAPRGRARIIARVAGPQTLSFSPSLWLPAPIASPASFQPTPFTAREGKFKYVTCTTCLQYPDICPMIDNFNLLSEGDQVALVTRQPSLAKALRLINRRLSLGGREILEQQKESRVVAFDCEGWGHAFDYRYLHEFMQLHPVDHLDRPEMLRGWYDQAVWTAMVDSDCKVILKQKMRGRIGSIPAGVPPECLGRLFKIIHDRKQPPQHPPPPGISINELRVLTNRFDKMPLDVPTFANALAKAEKVSPELISVEGLNIRVIQALDEDPLAPHACSLTHLLRDPLVPTTFLMWNGTSADIPMSRLMNTEKATFLEVQDHPALTYIYVSLSDNLPGVPPPTAETISDALNRFETEFNFQWPKLSRLHKLVFPDAETTPHDPADDAKMLMELFLYASAFMSEYRSAFNAVLKWSMTRETYHRIFRQYFVGNTLKVQGNSLQFTHIMDDVLENWHSTICCKYLDAARRTNACDSQSATMTYSSQPPTRGATAPPTGIAARHPTLPGSVPRLPPVTRR